MSWIRIDDGAPEHPKQMRAGPDACWLWVRGLAYCSRYLTDGLIPHAVVVGWGGQRAFKLAVRLVDVGLWEYAEDGAYRVHDYHVYQPSSEQADLRREQGAVRTANWRARREAGRAETITLDDWIRVRELHGGKCAYCGAARNITIDHVVPLQRGGKNSADNIAPACARCNKQKNAKTADEFVAYDPSKTLPKRQGDASVTPLRTEQNASPNPDPNPVPDPKEPVRTRAVPLGSQSEHRSHAVCGRVCLPAWLYREFIKARGGPEDEARADVDAWALAIIQALPDETPIGDDPLKFWRFRWQERFGTTRQPPRTSASPLPSSDDDWCHHEPPCNSREWHEMKMHTAQAGSL